MTTQAMPVEIWEDVELAECIRCAAAVPVAPVPGGVEIGGGRLCLGCFYKVFKGDRARAAEALGLAGAGDDDGPDGGPAPAAPSARPVRPVSLATWTGAPVYLTAEELAELDEFEQAVAETEDPLPCVRCGKVATPAVLTGETGEGLTLCLACGEGPDAPPEAREAVRDVRFAATCRRLACARLSRELAGVR